MPVKISSLRHNSCLPMRIDHGLLPGHVLQRTRTGARATVTGTCAASGRVLATVRKGAKALPGFKALAVGTAAEGRFNAVLSGLPTGGPYTVELACAGSQVLVPEIFVGDLWLLGGQSNMEGVGLLCDATEPHPLVRAFTMARRWELATDPLHFLPESPDSIHDGVGLSAAEAKRAKRRALKGAGVGVHFAKRMHARSGVPQGLIPTAHGGTSMAGWDPALKDQGGASLYGSMWLTLQALGQPVAGMLWYQGCSETNADTAAVYTARMQALVAALRRDLGQPKLPWVIIQIGRVVSVSQEPRQWNAIQEQQRRLPETIPYSDVVPSVDLELDDQIHVSGRAFAVLADRMARVAARLALGDRSEKAAPQPLSVRQIEGKPGRTPTLEVRFANVVGGLIADGLPQGFSVVDGDQRQVDGIFKTVLKGDRAILHLKDGTPSPCWLMYGRGPDPVCNLRDGRGMAIPVFGPWQFSNPVPVSAWFLRWLVSPIQPGENIANLPKPGPDDAGMAERCFPPEFVNLHSEWMGHSGHVGYSGHVDIPEDMDLELRTGYDGPFRLWVGEREIHRDLHGTNPAVKDGYRLPLHLGAGRHPISILIALNGGRAYGFFMRFARIGVIPSEQPLMPKPWA